MRTYRTRIIHVPVFYVSNTHILFYHTFIREHYLSSCPRRQRTLLSALPAAAAAGDNVCSTPLWRDRLERSGRFPTSTADDAVGDVKVMEWAVKRRWLAGDWSTRGYSRQHLSESLPHLPTMTSEHDTWPLHLALTLKTPFCHYGLTAKSFLRQLNKFKIRQPSAEH